MIFETSEVVSKEKSNLLLIAKCQPDRESMTDISLKAAKRLLEGFLYTSPISNFCIIGCFNFFCCRKGMKEDKLCYVQN